MIDILIIDPSSTEFNRGSFCYLPYILYSYFKEKGYKVEIAENFTCSDIDKLPPAKEYYVALWSYPQIDACRILNYFLPKIPVYFGYYPLIEQYKLKEFRISDDIIKEGIKSYVKYYREFKYILLSDCDMHLSKYEGVVYPLFTSYGCTNKCNFCPVSPNCKRKRIVVETSDVLEILDYCFVEGYKNIHFTDEDFFFDIERTYQILSYAKNKDFKFIALGSVNNVLKFLDRYGLEIIADSGLKLIEVGLESADEYLSRKMGKGNIDKYELLAKKAKGVVDIFWLVITYFPGETISSLRNTSLFLNKYGFELDELYGRVRTNSTKGGLGQFFQPYCGVKENYNSLEDFKQEGFLISNSPMRLIPSFIPDSFLNCVVSNHREIKKEEIKWFELYKLNDDLIYDKINFARLCIRDIFTELIKKYTPESVAIYLALLARLGIIE